MSIEHDCPTAHLGAFNLNTGDEKKESRTQKCMQNKTEQLFGKADRISQAAEKSLSDLKNLPRTSEAQIAAGLSLPVLRLVPL